MNAQVVVDTNSKQYRNIPRDNTTEFLHVIFLFGIGLERQPTSRNDLTGLLEKGRTSKKERSF